VPQKWVDAILIAIPKKGNFTIGDHSFLGTTLPTTSNNEVMGRRCNDVMVTIQQMLEKAVWNIFVDLRKAYDLVPRKVLGILGVSEVLFHYSD